MGISKTAIMEQGGKRIVMNGDAYVHRQPDANNDLLDVRSQQLIILPDEDVVYTDLPAEVLKGRSRMNGTGMHYNNRTRQLQVSASTDVEIAGGEGKQQRRTEIPAPTIPTRRSHDRPPDSPCPDDAPDRRRPAAGARALGPRGGPRAPAGGRQAAPAEEPSTLILSDTLHYDDVKKQSVFTGNVNMTRGLMTLTSDTLEMHEDAKGNQYGTATANKGKVVTIRQERPENFELIEGKGLRAEYDGTNSTFDLIGQAVVVRYVCGKPFDTIRGERVRYNERAAPTKPMAAPTRPRPAAGCARWPSPAPRRTPPSPNAASSRPRRRALSASPQHIRRHA